MASQVEGPIEVESLKKERQDDKIVGLTDVPEACALLSVSEA